MKALKKVPSDAKGLSKLPSEVRNKMGYMKEGGKVKKRGKAKQALINLYNGQTNIQKKRSAKFDELAKEVNTAKKAQQEYYKGRKG